MQQILEVALHKSENMKDYVQNVKWQIVHLNKIFLKQTNTLCAQLPSVAEYKQLSQPSNKKVR
jgi:hypothetical protein